MSNENTKPAAGSAVSAPDGFPEELRKIAAEAQISQRQIGEALGVSTRTVEEWCAGRHEPQPYVQRLVLAELRRRFTEDSIDTICDQIEKVERTECDDVDRYAARLRDGRWVFFAGMNEILRRFIFDNRHCKHSGVTITGTTEYTR